MTPAETAAILDHLGALEREATAPVTATTDPEVHKVQTSAYLDALRNHAPALLAAAHRGLLAEEMRRWEAE